MVSVATFGWWGQDLIRKIGSILPVLLVHVAGDDVIMGGVKHHLHTAYLTTVANRVCPFMNSPDVIPTD